MSCPAPDLNPPDCPACIVLPRGPHGSAGRRYLLTILQADGTAQPMAADGTALAFEITGPYTAGTILLSYDLTDGIEFADPSTGVGILTIPSGAFDDRTVWEAGTEYAWSLWLTLPGDAASPYRQAGGALRIENVA